MTKIKRYTNEKVEIELVKMEQQKPVDGFKRGVLKEHFEKLAKENNLSFYTIRTLYYDMVKDKVDPKNKQTTLKTLETPEIKKENQEEMIYSVYVTLKVNRTEIRIILINKEKHYILSDICDSLSVSRANDLIKTSLTDDMKLSVSLKSKYGSNKVMVINNNGLCTLLNTVITYFDNAMVLERANELLKIVPKEEFETKKNSTIKDGTRKGTFTDKSPYRTGQIIEVKIQGITDFGAYIETNDEHKVHGLIHISELQDCYISDVHQYLEVGDIVKAKIRKIVSPYKIEVSTRDFYLPIKTEKKIPTITTKVTIEETQPKPEMQVKVETQPTNESKDMKEIMEYLHGVVGPLTPKAKEILSSIIEEHGVFKFALMVNEESKVFKADLGAIFLHQVADKMGNGL